MSLGLFPVLKNLSLLFLWPYVQSENDTWDHKPCQPRIGTWNTGKLSFGVSGSCAPDTISSTQMIRRNHHIRPEPEIRHPDSNISWISGSYGKIWFYPDVRIYSTDWQTLFHLRIDPSMNWVQLLLDLDLLQKNHPDSSPDFRITKTKKHNPNFRFRLKLHLKVIRKLDRGDVLGELDVGHCPGWTSAGWVTSRRSGRSRLSCRRRWSWWRPCNKCFIVERKNICNNKEIRKQLIFRARLAVWILTVHSNYANKQSSANLQLMDYYIASLISLLKRESSVVSLYYERLFIVYTTTF